MKISIDGCGVKFIDFCCGEQANAIMNDTAHITILNELAVNGKVVRYCQFCGERVGIKEVNGDLKS